MIQKIKQLEKEIDSLKMEISQLHGLVEVDFLTGLCNRHGFTKRAEGFLKEIEWNIHNPEKNRRRMSIKDFIVIFIDLDDFKRINDTFGHDAGDAALKAMAEILRKNTKRIDILSRWAGDEFAVGLVGVSKEKGLQTAERLREKLSHYAVHNGETIHVTASFGVASAVELYRHHEKIDIYTLIEKTDEAMYHAKRKYGKNFVVDYSKMKAEIDTDGGGNKVTNFFKSLIKKRISLK